MPTLPGMQGDVYFGDPDKPLPDWRALPEDESVEDAPLSDRERAALAGMLGFDPAVELRRGETSRGIAKVAGRLRQSRHQKPRPTWTRASHQRLAPGRPAWVAWTVKSGPHKGRAAWKNPATGEIRYTPPTGKKADRVRAEAADGKAPRHAGIAGAPTAAQQAAARRWADASPGLSPDVAAEYVEHLSHALSMLPAGIARVAGAALEAGGVRFHPDLQTLRAEAQNISGKSAGGVVGFAHDRGMATDLHLDGGDDPRGTYVHELWHAADNGGFHSDDKGWQAAYKKDILKGKYLLSRYALTNASEGFAEFGRILAMHGLDYMSQRWPNAVKHLKSKGLI